MTAPEASTSEPAPARPRRRRRRLLLVAAALVVLVTLLPTLAAPIAASTVITRIEEALGGQTTLGELSLGWGGASLSALRIEDDHGVELLVIDQAAVRFSLLGLVTNSPSAEIEVDGLRLTVVEDASGRLNIDDLFETTPAGSVPRPDRPARDRRPADEQSSTLPELTAHVDLANVELTFQAADGSTTRLTDVGVSLHVEGLDEPATFSLQAIVTGPDSTGGALNANGSMRMTDGGQGGAAGLRGELSYTIDDLALAAFAPAARVLADIEGLTGTLEAAGHWTLDGPLAVSGDSRFVLRDLAVATPSGPPIIVPRIDIQAEARLDDTLSGDQLLRVKAGDILSFSYEGQTAVDGDGELPLPNGHAQLSIDPGRLSALLAPWPDLPRLDGLPLIGSFAVAANEGQVGIVGRLGSSLLVVELPPTENDPTPRRLEQRDLGLSLDLVLDPGPDADPTLLVRQVGLASRTAALTMTGHVGDELQLDVSVTAELRQLLTDLAPVIPADDWSADGKLATHLALRRTGPALVVTGDTEITALSLEGPALTLLEPRVKLDWDVSLADSDVIELRRLGLATSFVDGELSGRLVPPASDSGAGLVAQGLHGRFEYVPDELVRALGPALPVQLSGSEPRVIEFDVNGALGGADTRALLADLVASARIELGDLDLVGLSASGSVDLSNTADGMLIVGSFDMGGGTLNLTGRLDPGLARDGAQTPVSSLELSFSGLGTSTELGELLVYLHPLLAAAEPLGDASQVLARLEGGLTLEYAAPLPLEAGAELALDAIVAKGRLVVTDAGLAANPLLADMLAALGRSSERRFDLQPVAFTVSGGRLSYDNPWRWDLGSTMTSFSGSVGLDKSVDLVWHVPVTEELADEQASLRSMVGQILQVPIQGTVDSPKLMFNDVLGDLLRQVAQTRVDDAIDKRLGGLKGIFGGASEVAPEELLREADQLWDAGRKAEAKPLYRRLKDKHKFSLAYQTNKSRIKKRARARLD